MMDWKGIYISILLMGGLSFLANCTLDDPGASGSNPPLTLHADQNLSLITLSWDPVKVTGFKEYVILQSTSDIPNAPTPIVNGETIVLKRIDDSDIHSFTVSNTLFAPRLCYKLYTSVDDRFLYSSTVCVDQDFTLFPGFYDRAGHETGLDEIVLFDRVNARFSSMDYKNEVITKTVNDNNLSFPIIDVSTFEGITNVFAYDQSPPRMKKYRFPELTVLTYRDFSSVLFAVEIYKQFIFIAVDESFKSFQVLNRNNLNIIDTKPGITGNRNIAVFEGNPLVVLEIGETAINVYNIDQAGKISLVEQKPSGVSQMNTQNTIANSEEYFIGGRLGIIVNRNAEIIGNITNGINAFISMNRFSPDKSKVVSIINDNIRTRLEINDISGLPAISTIASYDIPPANYADVIVEDHIIYVIGVTFATGQAQTFILKYPI